MRIWAVMKRKLVWAFLILNFLLLRNQEACESAESSLTDLSLWVVDSADEEYWAEKESV